MPERLPRVAPSWEWCCGCVQSVMIVGFGSDWSRPIGSGPAAAPSSEQTAGRRLGMVPGPVAGLGSGWGLRGAEPGMFPSEERTAVSDHVAVRDMVEDTADCCHWRGGSADAVLG